MDAEHIAFPVVQVGVWDRAKPGRVLLRNRNDPFSILSLSRKNLTCRLVALEEPRVILEDIRTSVPNEVVYVLSVNIFVQNINVSSLAILNFSDRLDQPFILYNTLPIPKEIKVR